MSVQGTRRPKHRILIVDDVDDNRVVLQRQLERAGFVTIVCEGGISALGQVSADPPDLVVLDWMMPGLSGLDTLRGIRDHLDVDRLPVIMCTARDEESSIAIAMDAGANDYVQKPIRMPVLLARINTLLARKATIDALSDVNEELEATLAKRTNQLFDRNARGSDARDDEHARGSDARDDEHARGSDARTDENARDGD